MHINEWIINNWEKIKHKRVIWRTIGQSTPKVEEKLSKMRQEGMQIVRYSKREAYIPNNLGCDMIIPFYKDDKEYNGWVGNSSEVITISQNMAHRAEHCNYEAFKYLAKGFNSKLYGTSNEASGELWGGFMTYDALKQKMRDARVFIYTGTQPACYTLALIEAMMTGIPVVAIGEMHGNSLNIAGKMYEVPDIIHSGVNGFVSDDLDFLRKVIDKLVSDKELASRIGYLGRQRAIELFGKENVKARWKAFLQI